MTVVVVPIRVRVVAVYVVPCICGKLRKTDSWEGESLSGAWIWPPAQGGAGALKQWVAHLRIQMTLRHHPPPQPMGHLVQVAKVEVALADLSLELGMQCEQWVKMVVPEKWVMVKQKLLLWHAGQSQQPRWNHHAGQSQQMIV